ncbi:MAG TPA: hypothetical protein VLZ06_04400, partial [Solirubrobacteraceae bacterium]|nr:hypothetical protein [Solirubrobacteraceae bacterium]
MAAAVGGREVEQRQRDQPRDRAQHHDQRPPAGARAGQQHRCGEREGDTHDDHTPDSRTETGCPLHAGQRRAGQRHRQPAAPAARRRVQSGGDRRQHEHREPRLQVVSDAVKAGPERGIGAEQRAHQQPAAPQRV